MDIIIQKFYEYMRDINFDVYGILDKSNSIHTLGTDSKLIGRIFEMLSQPVLEKIAHERGLILSTPEKQNRYPDFILMRNHEATDKIAVDIKTTYIDNNDSQIKFTLGAYGSYMRNNTKNIEYKFTDYSKHYVIGFVYQRNGHAQESQSFNYDQRNDIQLPYSNVRYFIQEKYKISGDKPGSGNTENMGSISTRRFDDFIEGNGPFSTLGENAFEIYWKYYPQYRTTGEYTSLDGFSRWFLSQPPASITLLHNFDYDATKRRIKAYADRLH